MGRSRIVANVDSTGEVHDVKEAGRRRPPNGKLHYALIDLETMIPAARELSGMQMAILLVILADYRIDQGWARLSVQEIADGVGTSRNNAYRAIKPMIEAGVLTRQGNLIWMVNSRLAWRGKREDWLRARSSDTVPVFDGRPLEPEGVADAGDDDEATLTASAGLGHSDIGSAGVL